MAAYYDTIAQQDQQVHASPRSLYINTYTYLHLLGELTGKSILDLGCGEGFYTRQLSHEGATRVVGGDISPQMLELAQQKEARNPQGIEYLTADVCQLGQISSFDLVVASYLLNHVQTKAQLLQMCQTIYLNLKPKGRFVGINDNVEQSPKSYPVCAKSGLTKSISQSLAEGTPITNTFSVDGQKFSLYDYYLSRATAEWAFRRVGFKEIPWQSPIVSPKGRQKFGQEFGQDFLDYQSLAIKEINYEYER